MSNGMPGLALPPDVRLSLSFSPHLEEVPSPLKLLHTADIHLGTSTYGRLDPATGLNSRLLDFQRAFEFMVQKGIDEDIDLFLFCGDAYRTADPTPTQQRVFAECLRPLARHGVPIAMITGNHDHPVSFGKASAIDIFGYVEGDVHVFRRPDVQAIPTKSGPLQLVAMPWPIRSMVLSREEHRKKSATEVRAFIEERYATFIREAAAELDPALPAVLAGHFTVQGAEVAGSERTSLIAHEPKFLPSQLAVPPLDYVALGHIHRFQNRNEAGGIPIVYSSSIERVSFKEMDDPKGFVLVDIEVGGGEKRTSFTFAETPARRFVAIGVDVREAPEPTEPILRAIAGYDVGDAVVRVRYHVTEAQAPLVDVRRIREALSEAHAVAAIERTVEPTERQRRTVVTREASLQEAMQHYVAQNDHLAPLKDELVRAALEIEEEHEARRRTET